jgi:hypothetical protein
VRSLPERERYQSIDRLMPAFILDEHPDGAHLALMAVGSPHNRAAVWERRSGRIVWRTTGHAGFVLASGRGTATSTLAHSAKASSTIKCQSAGYLRRRLGRPRIDQPIGDARFERATELSLHCSVDAASDCPSATRGLAHDRPQAPERWTVFQGLCAPSRPLMARRGRSRRGMIPGRGRV